MQLVAARRTIRVRATLIVTTVGLLPGLLALALATLGWTLLSGLIVIGALLRLRWGAGRRLGAPFSIWRVAGSVVVAYSSAALLLAVPYFVAFYFAYPVVGPALSHPLTISIVLSSCVGLVVAGVMVVTSTIVNVMHAKPGALD